MRYKLLQDGVVVDSNDDLADLISANWLLIKVDWQSGFVIDDARPDVHCNVWCACWRDEFNGVELSPITPGGLDG